MKPNVINMRYVHHKTAFYKHEHTHDMWELAYYVNGFGSLSRDGQSYEYTNGTIHLVKANTPHDENNMAESKIMLVYFTLSESDIPSGVYHDKSGAILTLLRTLRTEMNETLRYNREISDAIFIQILYLLRRQLFPSPTECTSFHHIIRHIDENFQFDIDIHEIAAKSCYSYDRFRHIFKEHTGCSPHEYILDKRIDLAKFLIETDKSISLCKLANECGFNSPSQFSNAFRSRVGMTPTNYIATLLKNQ